MRCFSLIQNYIFMKKNVNTDTAFDCDYLMVHESGKAILHLGLIKSEDRKNVYHCNSFMTTYQTDREKNLFFVICQSVMK